MVIIDKPISVSIILPANITTDVAILDAKPINSPTIASLRTIIAYSKTVPYTMVSCGIAALSIKAIMAEKPILARLGIPDVLKNGATDINVTILMNTSKRYSISEKENVKLTI